MELGGTPHPPSPLSLHPATDSALAAGRTEQQSLLEVFSVGGKMSPPFLATKN